jgi:alpha-L-arabinofuranosidase
MLKQFTVCHGRVVPLVPGWHPENVQAAHENVVVAARPSYPRSPRAHGRSGRRSPPPGVARASASFASAFLVAALLTVAAGVHSAARPITKGKLPPVLVNIMIGPKTLGRISSRLFGSNLLWPYDAEGAFDQSTHSFYPSFVAEVRELGVTSLRYPAGITADNFDWLHAIGPESRRLPNEPYGMQSAELSKICCTLDGPAPSTVGPDEFGRLLDATGSVGDVVVNFATGTADEAADFVAYMTAPDGEQPSSQPSEPGFWAALRAKNGHPLPYDVPFWEVGNEQDGYGQNGWRSGTVVSVGPHKTVCPQTVEQICLYAFGGTTAFSDEPVGILADELPSASYSNGLADQAFYVYFPPVVPASQTVEVGGVPWQAVPSLSRARPNANVYQFIASKGEILFGNGVHGAIPPEGWPITASYESGPHGGFVEFYRAMKAMGPHAQICETEEERTVFLQVMGRTYPYDCVELHKYAKPLDLRAPMPTYEQNLMDAPYVEGQKVAALQQLIRRYSGRNVPIVITEYGQLVRPMPYADPDFGLTLDEGLLVASQLRQWIAHGILVAEKYLLVSTPFLSDNPVDLSVDPDGLSVNSAMLAGPGPTFVTEPSGKILGLMAHLGGTERLASNVEDDPVMQTMSSGPTTPGGPVPILQTVAGASNGNLDLVVINVSPDERVTADVSPWELADPHDVTATLLDGPSPLAYNTYAHPDRVGARTWTVQVNGHYFVWNFPAHSVTLLRMPLLKPGVYRV